jgi:hypothetical protein
MNLGLALYGRTFTLASAQNTPLGAAIVDGGGEGKHIRAVLAIGLITSSFSWSLH